MEQERSANILIGGEESTLYCSLPKPQRKSPDGMAVLKTWAKS